MKKILFTACAVAIALSSVRADDVALLTFKVGNDKKTKQAAIEFYEADAPQTVANFKKLAQKRFYNGLSVHRVFPHIIVQMGDPLSGGKDRSKVGTGGPGYTLPPEIHRPHIKGAVAAARLSDKINPGRFSNGSQFLICLEPMPSYDGKYTVFGNVIWGLEGLDEISQLPVDTNDNPLQRVRIESIKIIPREQLPAGPGLAAPASAPKKPWWKLSPAAPKQPAPAPAPAAASAPKKPWWQFSSAAPKQPAPTPAPTVASTPKKPAPTPAPPVASTPKKPWWQFSSASPKQPAPTPAPAAASTPKKPAPAPASTAATTSKKPAPAPASTPAPAPKKPWWKIFPSAPKQPAPAPASTDAPAPKKPWWKLF